MVAAVVAAAAAPMATVTTSANQARAFLLVAGKRLQALQQRLQALLAAWCADWGLGGLDLHSERAWESPLAAYKNWQASAAAGLWYAMEPSFVAQVQAQMLAPELGEAVFSDGIASAAASRAVQDLRARLAALLPAAVSAPTFLGTPASADACFAHASGAVLVQIAGGAMACLFDAAALNGLLGPAPVSAVPALNLVPRKQAIAHLPVRLVVEVGKAEVNLGNFLAIELGDVVRVNRAIDAPLHVAAMGGGVVFDGYLGKIGDTMAIEAVRHTAPD